MTNRTIEVGSNYDRLFSALPKDAAPAYLCEQVVGRIRTERIQKARARLVGASLVGITSTILGTYIALLGVNAAASSGFTSYLGLAFSDQGAVLRDVGSFGLSLLESFPGVEVTAFLALLALLIGSLRVVGDALRFTNSFTTAHRAQAI